MMMHVPLRVVDSHPSPVHEAPGPCMGQGPAVMGGVRLHGRCPAFVPQWDQHGGPVSQAHLGATGWWGWCGVMQRQVGAPREPQIAAGGACTQHSEYMERHAVIMEAHEMT
jgi:hypothetical protein